MSDEQKEVRIPLEEPQLEEPGSPGAYIATFRNGRRAHFMRWASGDKAWIGCRDQRPMDWSALVPAYAIVGIVSADHALDEEPEPEVPDADWLVGLDDKFNECVAMRQPPKSQFDTLWYTIVSRDPVGTVETTGITRVLSDLRPLDLSRTYEDGYAAGVIQGSAHGVAEGLAEGRRNAADGVAERDSTIELLAKGVQELRERVDALDARDHMRHLTAVPDADPPTTLTPGVVELIEAARRLMSDGRDWTRLKWAVDALDGEEWKTMEGYTSPASRFHKHSDWCIGHACLPATLCWRVPKGGAV